MAECVDNFMSVIVPSFNRKDEIQELLTSLESQDLSNDRFEVIIVDDGSTDGTDGWIYDFSKTSDLDLKFIRQDHK